MLCFSWYTFKTFCTRKAFCSLFLMMLTCQRIAFWLKCYVSRLPKSFRSPNGCRFRARIALDLFQIRLWMKYSHEVSKNRKHKALTPGIECSWLRSFYKLSHFCLFWQIFEVSLKRDGPLSKPSCKKNGKKVLWNDNRALFLNALGDLSEPIPIICKKETIKSWEFNWNFPINKKNTVREKRPNSRINWHTRASFLPEKKKM